MTNSQPPNTPEVASPGAETSQPVVYTTPANKRRKRRRSFLWWQAFFIRGSILVSVSLIILFTARELADNSFTIQPFTLPAEYVEKGYTGEVFSGVVLHKLNNIIDEANNRRTLKELEQYNGSSGKIHVKLEISGVAISPEVISSYIKHAFGVTPRSISGAVIRFDNSLALFLTISGHPLKVISQNMDSLSMQKALSILSTKAAEEILKTQNHLLAGLYFYEERRLEEAIDHFKAAVYEQPEYKSTAYAHWGDAVVIQTRDTLTASKLIRKGLAIDPNNGTAYRILGNMTGQFSLQKAERYYRKSVKVDPTSERSWYRLGQVLQQDSSREMEAIKCYQKAYALNKSNTGSLVGLIEIFYFRKEYDKASEYLEYFDYLQPEDAAHLKIALAEATGDSTQSRALIEKSTDKTRLADELNSLAFKQEIKKNYRSGFRLINLALMADSSYAIPYTTRAELCALTGNADGFYLNLEKALQKGLPLYELRRMENDELYRKKSSEARYKDLVRKYQ